MMVWLIAAPLRLVGRLFIGASVLFLAHNVWAQSASDDSARIASLAKHPMWLRLLKADKERSAHSAVHTPQFFLSGDPDATPLQELTLALQSENIRTQDPNDHPRCRYPARYFWLSQQLERPSLRNFEQCERLLRWAQFDSLDSVSLIMISGYFGNPASTFGHSLMRLNNSKADTNSPLLDLGINFGAQIPPNEPTAIYILRGLFGGYQAGFSDRTFFEHDQTYSRIEFRDRWEYELALTDDQRTLLALHLWEMAGQKFTYYFLHQNCSYRLAELLEVALDTNIVDDVSTWYAPVSLFHDLRAIEEQRGVTTFRDITYIPSVERVLRHGLDALGAAHRDTVTKLIDPAIALHQIHLPDDTRQQQQIYSTTLDYFTYLLTNSEEGEDLTLKARKDAIVLQRLSLPASAAVRPDPPPRPPPSSQTAPTALDVGFTQRPGNSDFATVGIAAFRYSGIGNNALENSSLVVADLSLGYASGAGIFVNQLDIVRARKINAPITRLVGESRTSWEVALGMQRARETCLTCLETFAEGWLGIATRPSENWLTNVSIAGRLSSKDSATEIGPRAAVTYLPHWRWQAELSAASLLSPSRGTTSRLYRLQSRYTLRTNLEVVLDGRKTEGSPAEGTTITLAISQRW